MSTALDIITGALRKINEYAAGEPLDDADAADALAVLNDLLEMWSTEGLMVFSNTENIVTLTANQYQYTIGNPIGGTILGTTVSGTPTISNVTVFPTGLIVGSYLSGAGIPSGTTVLSIGASTITMSANATATYPTLYAITYTTPGDFAVDRPLHIRDAFVRITTSGSAYDYPITIDHIDQYASIGLKSLSGPWPTHLYYDPLYPLGKLYFYPNPSTAGELHLWCDSIMQNLTSLNETLNIPQGYSHALKTNLALLLAPEYGAEITPDLRGQALAAKAYIKNLNAVVQPVSTFDSTLARSRRNDAGWILHGGFK